MMRRRAVNTTLWKRLCWNGPHGETGHSLWLRSSRFVFDIAWCTQMDLAYPGWAHLIQEQWERPEFTAPEGWVEHPLYGNMEHGPMGL